TSARRLLIGDRRGRRGLGLRPLGGGLSFVSASAADGVDDAAGAQHQQSENDEAEHAQRAAATAGHVRRQPRARLARLPCSSVRLRTTIGRSHRVEPRPKRKSIQMTHRSGLETNAPGSAAPFPEVAEPVLRHVQTTIISWFSTSARELPWREPGTSAWAVLV